MKVLVADDDFFIGDALEGVLARAGVDGCGVARTVSEAVDRAAHHTPALAARLSSARRIGIL